MSINERIRQLRKERGLTQTEFGAKIGLKKSASSFIEKEGTPITEQNIKLICEKFHVRREWLVDGTGDVYEKEESADPIMLWAEKLVAETGDTFPRRLASCLAKLEPQGWIVLEQIFKNIVKDSAEEKTIEEQIDEKVEAYRRQLLAEAAQKGGESSTSAAPAPEKRA